MTSRRPRPERRALAIAPIPQWLSELAGAEVTRAAAWRTGRSVCIRLATPGGRQLLELADGQGAMLGWRIETDLGPPRRRPLRELGSMRTEARAALARFVRRFGWMDASEDAAPDGYRPTEREARVRTLARALSQVRTPEDAADIGPDRDTADPLLRAVELYLDVLGGRWERLFVELDGPTTPIPAWLAPILVGLGGDAIAMRTLATEALGRRRHAGAYEVIAAIAFGEAGFHEAARRAYEAAMEGMVGPMCADLCVVLSKQCRARGREEEAVAWARRAVMLRSHDDRLVSRACSELVRCGALDDAYAVLRERSTHAPVDGAVALGLAELLLWAGRADTARPWLDRALVSSSEDARALRCLGVLHALEGRWTDAREAFSDARQRAPDDMEIGTWLSEVHLRLGDHATAGRLLAESRAVTQTPVHSVLVAALAQAEALAHRPEILALLDALGEPREPWLATPDGPRDAALSLLDSFGGNRGDPPTRRVSEPGEGSLGLEIVRLPEDGSMLSSRDASADTLKLLRTTPIAEVQRRFEALAQRYPDSPHPLCYWGELDLWLGEYERAIGRFEAALARGQARWGYVGQAAARILLGEYEAADEAIAACARVFDPVPGATTHVYVGEALRRRGDHRGAVEELTEAVRVKPGRAGAWMNLALAHRELGAREQAARIFHRLEARLPRLCWDAWRALGHAPQWPIPPEHMPELFDKALEMMRGNRSSHTITYIDVDGIFRIARDASAWRTAMANHASFVAIGMQTALAAGEVRGEGDR